MMMTYRFEANGRQWLTDQETLELLRNYRNATNEKMVEFVFHAGRASGRIIDYTAQHEANLAAVNSLRTHPRGIQGQ